jgi:lysophospholipase L1-like esterase
MSPEKRKFLTPPNILIITLFLVITTYIYRGFYFPDPIIFYLHWSVSYLLKGIKLFFPIIIITLIILYRSVYLNKIQLSSVILLFFTFFFFLLLAYPFADYFYRKSLTENIDELHSYLQINPPPLKDIDSNNFNIFCLGGSTTEFKDSLGRDWPGMVENEINRDSIFKEIRLINYGKQWYSTQHILIHYVLNLKQYKPNAIIVMENINDLLHNADFSWLSKGKYRDDYGNFLGPLTRLVKYGGFAQFLERILKGLWYHEKAIEVEPKSFPGLKAFEKNLNTLISLAKEDSTKIILMTQPNIYKDSMSLQELKVLAMLNGEAIGNGQKWSYNTALNGFKLYNDKIREIALNKNVYLIDLEKNVPKNLQYFYDDVHYRSKTYDLIVPYVVLELDKILRNSL